MKTWTLCYYKLVALYFNILFQQGIKLHRLRFSFSFFISPLRIIYIYLYLLIPAIPSAGSLHFNIVLSTRESVVGSQTVHVDQQVVASSLFWVKQPACEVVELVGDCKVSRRLSRIVLVLWIGTFAKEQFGYSDVAVLGADMKQSIPVLIRLVEVELFPLVVFNIGCAVTDNELYFCDTLVVWFVWDRFECFFELLVFVRTLICIAVLRFAF